jgi:hypothetical protein
VPKPAEVSQCAPICEKDPYPLLEPGIYEAQCLRTRIYFDPQFRAWKALLEFQLVNREETVGGFIHLGQGESTKAGQRSRYRRAWIIANGEPPKKRQVLSERIFVGKFFEVQIGTVEKAHDGRDHPVGGRYSTVTEILRRLP